MLGTALKSQSIYTSLFIDEWRTRLLSGHLIEGATTSVDIGCNLLAYLLFNESMSITNEGVGISLSNTSDVATCSSSIITIVMII